MTVYVDTSGFYAFVCEDDQDHPPVLQTMLDLARKRERLLTTSYVLCETMGLLQHRLGVRVLREFVQKVIPLLDVVWVGREEHEAAWALMLDKPRRALTVVDATGIVIMRRERVRRCLALDPEFAREGFEVLPSSL